MTETLCPAHSFIQHPHPHTSAAYAVKSKALMHFWFDRSLSSHASDHPLPSSLPLPRIASGFSREADEETMAIRLRHRVPSPFVSSYAYIMQLTHEYIQRERTISWEPRTSFVLNIKKTWRKVASSRGRVGCFMLYVLIWNQLPQPRDTFRANYVDAVSSSQHGKLW